jgi:hypothetical protein
MATRTRGVMRGYASRASEARRQCDRRGCDAPTASPAPAPGVEAFGLHHVREVRRQAPTASTSRVGVSHVREDGGDRQRIVVIGARERRCSLLPEERMMMHEMKCTEVPMPSARRGSSGRKRIEADHVEMPRVKLPGYSRGELDSITR